MWEQTPTACVGGERQLYSRLCLTLKSSFLCLFCIRAFAAVAVVVVIAVAIAVAFAIAAHMHANVNFEMLKPKNYSNNNKNANMATFLCESRCYTWCSAPLNISLSKFPFLFLFIFVHSLVGAVVALFFLLYINLFFVCAHAYYLARSLLFRISCSFPFVNWI